MTHTVWLIRYDIRSILNKVLKIENDENSILKRLQWSIAANPRIEPINNDVLRAREERKILLSRDSKVTLSGLILIGWRFLMPIGQERYTASI